MRVFSVTASVLALWLMLFPGAVLADNLRVAVASNFASVLTQLAPGFRESSGHDIQAIPGATGRHYAQVINGAPFDVLLAADAERPELLEASGHAVSGSRFTYALGKLVLWSKNGALIDSDGNVLAQAAYRYLAMANPALSPYGSAAREVLDSMNLWGTLQGRLVQGENISQTLQFVESGNAELGFIAYSQWLQVGSGNHGSYWVVPPQLHAPLEQQAVLLRDSAAARAFADYLKTDAAREIIQAAGYELP